MKTSLNDRLMCLSVFLLFAMILFCPGINWASSEKQHPIGNASVGAFMSGNNNEDSANATANAAGAPRIIRHTNIRGLVIVRILAV